MANALGTFLVNVVLIVLGIFLMTAAYSRKPFLLKLASLGTIHIDPDSPGRRQRAILFSIGVAFSVVGLLLIVVEKLVGLGVLPGR